MRPVGARCRNFGPKLLDDLCRLGQEARRRCEPKGRCCPQVDCEIEVRRLDDGQFGHLRPLENGADILPARPACSRTASSSEGLLALMGMASRPEAAVNSIASFCSASAVKLSGFMKRPTRLIER